MHLERQSIKQEKVEKYLNHMGKVFGKLHYEIWMKNTHNVNQPSKVKYPKPLSNPNYEMRLKIPQNLYQTSKEKYSNHLGQFF